jgi:hypothetical protein
MSPYAIEIFTTLAATLLVGTAVMHSLLGERLFVRPLLGEGGQFYKRKLAGFLLRLAWHLLSVSWVTIAAILLTIAFWPGNLPKAILWIIGATFTVIGLYDAIGSRGRHVAWPLFTAVGILSLLAGNSF